MENRDTIEEVLRRGYRYALALSHRAADAEELVQEAAFRLCQRGGPWTAPYFLTVIRNGFVDAVRRQGIVRFDSIDEACANVELPVATRDDHDGLDGPMHRALSTLTPAERELLYLSAVEQYTARELSEMIGRPRGTVLSTLHRAKKKLRARLSSDGVHP